MEEVHRARNLRDSRYGYELDGPSLLAANELDDEGQEVFIYHSHPRSPAEPSQTDINLAHYPHWLYVIVSLEAEPAAARLEDRRWPRRGRAGRGRRSARRASRCSAPPAR